MADSKVFALVDGIDCEMVGRAVESFLRDTKNLTAEGMKTPEGYFVQAKESDNAWKKVAGMSLAIQVQIIETGSNITVNVGNGQWADKAGAAAVGMFLFAPLAVTAAIGATNQKKLPQEILNFIEHFIMSGGKSVVVSTGASRAVKENQVLCPKCKTLNDKGVRFCTSCGSALAAVCSQCHTSVALGVKFCPQCGSSMNLLSEEKHCPECGAAVASDKKFCPECGCSMEEEKRICPICGAEISSGQKFCGDCGERVE